MAGPKREARLRSTVPAIYGFATFPAWRRGCPGRAGHDEQGISDGRL